MAYEKKVLETGEIEKRGQPIVIPTRKPEQQDKPDKKEGG